MKNLLKIVPLLLAFQWSLAQPKQDSSFTLLHTYSGDITDAAMDNLDNLYIVSSTGQVRKFTADGDSTAVYNQVKNSGKLFSLDVSNPLRPLLFYKDFSTVVLLDRFLADRARIDLRRYHIFQPAAVGLSYDNNILVFDEYDNKLKKIDEAGNLLLETADFRTVFAETIRPQKIISDNGLVYLGDPVNGVFVFDNYGSFKKKLPVKNWQNIAIKENYLIQTRPNAIVVFNTTTYVDATKPVPTAFAPYLRSFSTATKFVAFTNSSLNIYRYHF